MKFGIALLLLSMSACAHKQTKAICYPSLEDKNAVHCFCEDTFCVEE